MDEETNLPKKEKRF